jgi:uracil-DNA glycosylase
LRLPGFVIRQYGFQREEKKGKIKRELLEDESMADEVHEVVRDLKSYLEYLREMGIEGLPVAERTAQKNSPDSPPARPSVGTLEEIRRELGDCRRCKLHSTRRTIVFGEGNPGATLMFVGEGPGHDEDIQGRPFVGKAGQLLTKIIESIKLRREDVYIANIVKCRPPGNRTPEPDEIKACNPFLLKQIEAIRPKIICTLGAPSSQTLLRTTAPISALRGRWFDFHGIRVIPTFHPAYLLRNPERKKEVWEDMKRIMEWLSHPDTK